MTNTTTSNDDHATEGIKQPFWLLKDATAKKLGKQSEGGIGYRILTDADRKSLYLCIRENIGGAGYFSDEMVPFPKVEACLTKREQEKPFPSKSFKEAFIGRSSNNAPFLAAILRAEKLLMAAPASETHHLVSADWTEWKNSMLSIPGKMIETDTTKAEDMGVPEESVSEHTEKRKTLTLKRTKPANPAE